MVIEEEEISPVKLIRCSSAHQPSPMAVVLEEGEDDDDDDDGDDD